MVLAVLRKKRNMPGMHQLPGVTQKESDLLPTMWHQVLENETSFVSPASSAHHLVAPGA